MLKQTTNKIPEIGDFLDVSEIEIIYAAVAQRRKNFPDEPEILALSLVLMNIGNRYTPVVCQEGEWEGVIQDVPKGEGKPKCPNGHELTKGLPLKLAWLA